MRGPVIIARSISALRIPDSFNNTWQYHSRSDRHSKIACWSIMFDLIGHCSLLRQHIADRKVGFGINHELRDFRTQRKKKLDLVVCTPNPSGVPRVKNGGNTKRNVLTFADLARECEVILDADDEVMLGQLPTLSVVA